MKTPPDSAELGNSGWTLLHTIAAYYPQSPSAEKQTQVLGFLQSFSQVYPCNYCAKDFQQDLQGKKPQVRKLTFLKKTLLNSKANKSFLNGCAKLTIA